MSTRTHPANGAVLHTARLALRLAIADLTTPQAWNRMLDVAARHRGRRVEDILLITRQQPDATELGTYEQWRVRGAHVRRGERGMALLRRLDDSGETYDVVRVFDVSQTDAVASPQRPAYDLVRVVSALAALAGEAGLRVRLGQGLPTATHVDGDRLDLAADLPLSAAAGHLVHHLARRLLPAGPHRHLQAAAIAHVVARRFGLRPPGLPAPDSHHWTALEPADPAVLRTVATVIDAADSLTTRLQRALTRRAKPAPVPAQRRPSAAAPSGPRPGPADADNRAALYAANTAAAEFYATHLRGSRTAADYLRSRGIAAAAGPGSAWQLGVAPPGGDALLRHLRAQGFTDQVLLAAGLVAVSELNGGGLYDLFRDRLMFPVHTPDGRIAGFTGRDLSGRSPAKFFNTPETPIFHKSRLLYGLAPQRTGPRPPDRFVVVEGPTDAIAAQTIYNRPDGSGPRTVAVASCGTAFTQAQFDLLKRRSGPKTALVMSFDADQAGARALDRAYPLAVTWPHGPVSGTRPSGFKDIADLLAARGPDEALAGLRAAERPLPLLGVRRALAKAFPEQFNADWPEDRVRAFRTIAPYLLDAVRQDLVDVLVQAAAEQLTLEPHEITDGVVAHFTIEDERGAAAA